MALRDYAKFAPIFIIGILVILIIYVIVTSISPSVQYPGKGLVDIVKDGVSSIL